MPCHTIQSASMSHDACTVSQPHTSAILTLRDKLLERADRSMQAHKPRLRLAEADGRTQADRQAGRQAGIAQYLVQHWSEVLLLGQEQQIAQRSTRQQCRPAQRRRTQLLLTQWPLDDGKDRELDSEIEGLATVQHSGEIES